MTSAEPGDGLGRGARATVLVLGLALIVHSVLVVAWLAPSSPLRDLLGGQRLAAYVDPYFAQGDDTVGIGSNRVDETFQVRAVVRTAPKAKATVTRWYDVTELDLDATRDRPSVDRARTSARRIAVTLNAAMLSLNAEQREIVAKIKAADDPAVTRTRMAKAGDDLRAIADYEAADEMARRYASMWLTAEVPDLEVVRVGYRVGRREVPSVARSNDSITGQDFTLIEMGWRRPFRATLEAREAFDALVPQGG